MKDQERQPGKPPHGPRAPSPAREEERSKPRRLAPDDLDRVVGGNQVSRNTKSPFDET